MSSDMRFRIYAWTPQWKKFKWQKFKLVLWRWHATRKLQSNRHSNVALCGRPLKANSLACCENSFHKFHKSNLLRHPWPAVSILDDVCVCIMHSWALLNWVMFLCVTVKSNKKEKNYFIETASAWYLFSQTSGRRR
jgi:hypothetical protein